MADPAGARQRHGDRDDLTDEHAFTDVGQLVLAILFVGIWIADSFFLTITTFLNLYLPLAVRIPAGGVLLVLAWLLSRASHRAIFGEARDEPQVVRTGVFSFVRHPMYLSEILLYLGVLVMSLSLMAGAVWLVTIGFLYFIARKEERLLLARFGDAYSEYMHDVPMWFPRIRMR